MKLKKNLPPFVLIGLFCFFIGVILTYFLISPPHLIPAPDGEYFSRLHQELQLAKKSIHVIMFEMRYYPEYRKSEANLLLQDLIEAQKNGLEVKVILEGGEAFLGQGFSDKQKKTCLYLQNSGVEVKFDREGLLTHAKLIIIDGEKIFLGSNNWNYYSLEKNKETSVLIKDSSFAKKYETYFQNLWRISKKADCRVISLKNCSSIAEILSRKYRCDKKRVIIKGNISQIKFKTSQAGNNYTIFKLTSQEKTLKVFTFGHPKIKEGEEVIVTGTYFQEKEVSGYKYYDEVEAEEIKKI